MAEKRMEVDLINERYWNPSTDLIRLNPLAQVPVLLKDGRAISGSQAICELLNDIQPDPPLLPGDAYARAEIRRIIDWFDGRFYHEVTFNLLEERIIKKMKGGGQPNSAGVKIGTRQIKWHLDYMNHLLERRKWLAGNVMSMADFAAAGHLSCLDYIGDIDWNRHDNVRDWYAKLKSRPAFRSLLADHLSGFPPPAHYSDLDF